MKKRNLILGLSLLLAGLPMVCVNAQFDGDNDSFFIASNMETQAMDAESKPVQVMSDEENETFRVVEEPGKMVLYYTDEIMTLSYVNDNKDKVYFSIRDEAGNMLFSRYFRKDPVVHSRVILSKLPAGEYYAVLRTDKDLFRKSFEISK